MKRTWNIWNFLTCFALSGSLALAQGALDNQSVMKLVSAHIADEVIVRLVSSETGNYNIAPEALIALKEAGASNQVIAAVVSRAASAPSAVLQPGTSGEALNANARGRFVRDPELQDPTAVKDTAMSPLIERSAIARQVRNRAVAPTPTETSSHRVQPIVLEDGTPIRLRLVRALTSAEAMVGEAARFEVLDEIRVGDVLVIPRGARAIGAVADAQHKRLLGFGGKLGLTTDWIQLPDGSKIPIRAEQQLTERGRGGTQSGEIRVRVPIQWTAAPFVVVKGKDAVLARGTQITAYCDGDYSVGISGRLPD